MTTDVTVQDTETVTPAPITQDVTETTTETGKDGKPFDPARAQALIEKLQSEVKTLKPKAKLADELTAAEQQRRDAELSEVEKLKKQLSEVQEREKAAAKREMQRAAADKHKLPAELATRLIGDNADELEADAAKLAATLPKPSATINPTNIGSAPVKATESQWSNFLYNNGPMPGA